MALSLYSEKFYCVQYLPYIAIMLNLVLCCTNGKSKFRLTGCLSIIAGLIWSSHRCQLCRVQNGSISGFSWIIYVTSLQARFASLPASPAGLLGRFAPSGFTLRACFLLALLARVLRFALPSCSFCLRVFRASNSRKFSKKKCVSINSKCSETRKNAKKKKFCPFLTHYALRA